MKISLSSLAAALDGELLSDELTRKLYATDASVYRRIPVAVAFPKHAADLQALVALASREKIGLIPRAAGTSLAGQCVGEGIVVDISKHFTEILKLDTEARTVSVQPGVIRDELNRYLLPHGLFFSPNTSTSAYCTIGGMVGNNSCGSTSIRYGSTRDKVIDISCVLTDGSLVTIGSQTASNIETGRLATAREFIISRLSPKQVQDEIRKEFPKPEIKRRNTGYAIDELLQYEPFCESGKPLNLATLLTGSEGTLALTTEVTLQLDVLPPPLRAMVATHYSSIDDCLQDVVPAMQSELYACEMLDNTILELTRNNAEQLRNRAFVEGHPVAILMLEVRSNTPADLDQQVNQLLNRLSATGKAYAMPVLRDNDIERAMDLRKAGLGILGNMVGDAKAVACIEDTAVALPDLAAYITQFSALMLKYQQQPVYYAHAGAGELHLRPILNLKTTAGVQNFKAITDEVATLVKSFGGSMSGEHGDGIVRAGYLPQMIGTANYELLREIKSAFDPDNILNPGKIVDAYPMDESLRYIPERTEPKVETFFTFADTDGILRMAEKCNGAGVCRKPVLAGGTMCPSFRATHQERDLTRGRANALREVLTNSEEKNRFNSEELKDVFDLCISCKACATECPSSVDVATMKAEFDYQYMQANGKSWRSWTFANTYELNKAGRITRKFTNYLFTHPKTSKLIKQVLGVAQERALPTLSDESLRHWCKVHLDTLQPLKPIGELYFFIDEFTDQLDTNVGIDALELLTKLGYRILLLDHNESGRAFISKGFLQNARQVAEHNVATYDHQVSKARPLVGIEPSAILTFRDEYLRLFVDPDAAQRVAHHSYTIDEFLSAEIAAGRITADQFTDEQLTIRFHGHCHQKALSTTASTLAYLNLPSNYAAVEIPSGCCGMAGSFGYEEEHFEISMRIGNQTLFPSVLSLKQDVAIAATGTSCRHQIKDGTGREAVHPVSLLRRALR